jgi:hypothetical protein
MVPDALLGSVRYGDVHSCIGVFHFRAGSRLPRSACDDCMRILFVRL